MVDELVLASSQNRRGDLFVVVCIVSGFLFPYGLAARGGTVVGVLAYFAAIMIVTPLFSLLLPVLWFPFTPPGAVSLTLCVVLPLLAVRIVVMTNSSAPPQLRRYLSTSSGT